MPGDIFQIVKWKKPAHFGMQKKGTVSINSAESDLGLKYSIYLGIFRDRRVGLL